MNEPCESPNGRLDWLKSRLQQAGHKATHQRLEVFREVIQTDAHPDAETVFLGVRERIPTISRNTVYQTLQFLVDQGYIAPFGIHQASHRYDRNTMPHHHLVCVCCGKVSDCTQSGLNLSHFAGFENWGRIDALHLELRGICSDCLSKQEIASS
ncbi:MAG: transcriptional repressor [Magnetococcales bacterium]|nr:transcriptional repressor [Magnetococcales bacterium]